MVTLYSGTPGSGKSLHLIELILRVLSWGKDVICNFPITFTEKEKKRGYDKRYYYMTNDQITVNTLLEFAIEHDYFEKRKESQCLVIIDEAGGRFNSRDYANSDRSAWIDFFSQHRKAGFDFILVAQMDRMIDRQIRGFVETEKIHRKITNFGPFQILPFPVFVSIEYWYVAKHRVGADFFLFRKKIANRYDSFKMFEGFKLSKELLAKVEARKKGKQDIKVNYSNASINAIYQETDQVS
jgi:zona occludens toxin (predicted ATPase)